MIKLVTTAAMLAVLTVPAFALQPAPRTHAKSEFILTANRITNVNGPREIIRLGERLPVLELKKRFSKYRVRSTFGEDCNVCVDISRGKLSFSVDFDESGTTIMGITCSSTECADALGNTIGASLRQALGSQASCDAGYVTTCKSIVLGLSYIVDENERCQFMIVEKKDTSIPSCARIGGFQILKG
jgi:hypothetical protein